MLKVHMIQLDNNNRINDEEIYIIYDMHITTTMHIRRSNSKFLLNEEWPKKERKKKIRLSMQCSSLINYSWECTGV